MKEEGRRKKEEGRRFIYVDCGLWTVRLTCTEPCRLPPHIATEGVPLRSKQAMERGLVNVVHRSENRCNLTFRCSSTDR